MSSDRDYEEREEKLAYIEEMLEDMTDWMGVDKSNVISLFEYNLLVAPGCDVVVAYFEDRTGQPKFVIQAIDTEYYPEEWEEMIRNAPEGVTYPQYDLNDPEDYVMMLIDMWNSGWEIVDWDQAMDIDEFIRELEIWHKNYEIPY